MREISNWLMLLFLAVCSISDLRWRGVRTWLLAAMSILLAVFCVFFTSENLWSMIGGIIVGILFWAFSYWTKESIGYADSWIILLLGAYLGGKKILMLVMLAFVSASVIALLGMLLKHWKKNKSMPFIPFLTAAYIGVMVV